MNENESGFQRIFKYRTKAFSLGKCPVCGQKVYEKQKRAVNFTREVIFNKASTEEQEFYGCSSCNFTVQKWILGQKISQNNIKKLLKTGKTDIINHFEKDNKQFSARLYIENKEGKIGFLFDTKNLKRR